MKFSFVSVSLFGSIYLKISNISVCDVVSILADKATSCFILFCFIDGVTE